MLSSMLKRVDVAVYDTISGFASDSLESGDARSSTSPTTASTTRWPVARSTTRRRSTISSSRSSTARSRFPPSRPDPPVIPFETRDRTHRSRVLTFWRLTVTAPTQDPPAAQPDPNAPPAVELVGIVKRFPGVIANRDVNLRVAPGDDPRDRRRERCRQVHADEDPVRHAGARRGHHHRRRASRSRSAARPTRSTSASAWCTSTSCSPTTSRSSRTSSSATSPAGRSRSTSSSTPEPPATASSSSATRYGLAGRPRRPRRDARRRRAPAGRDPQGPVPRRHHPDPRRAHRGARAPGGRRAVRQPRRAQARGHHDPVHLPQARRGAADRRRHHRHPSRHHRRHPQAGRGRPPSSWPS